MCISGSGPGGRRFESSLPDQSPSKSIAYPETISSYGRKSRFQSQFTACKSQKSRSDTSTQTPAQWSSRKPPTGSSRVGTLLVAGRFLRSICTDEAVFAKRSMKKNRITLNFAARLNGRARRGWDSARSGLQGSSLT